MNVGSGRPTNELSTGSTDEEPIPPPTGTLFLCTLYLAALAGMWGAMYLIMLGR